MKHFFLWQGTKPGCEKITIGFEKGSHYTIVFKQSEQILDTHKTIERKDGGKDYEPILKMSYLNLKQMLNRWSNVNESLVCRFLFNNRINLGKLKHHCLLGFPLELDETQKDLFISQKRERQIKLQKSINSEDVFNILECPNSIFESQGNGFLLYSTKKGKFKQQGFIFRHPLDKRQRSFYFFSKRNLIKYMKEASRCFEELAQNN